MALIFIGVTASVYAVFFSSPKAENPKQEISQESGTTSPQEPKVEVSQPAPASEAAAEVVAEEPKKPEPAPVKVKRKKITNEPKINKPVAEVAPLVERKNVPAVEVPTAKEAQIKKEPEIKKEQPQQAAPIVVKKEVPAQAVAIAKIEKEVEEPPKAVKPVLVKIQTPAKAPILTLEKAAEPAPKVAKVDPSRAILTLDPAPQAAAVPVENKEGEPSNLLNPWGVFKPEFWVWLGVGQNFQYHRQSVPSIAEEAKFQNIQGPSIVFISGVAHENMGLEFSYKQSPGNMASSSVVTVVNGDFLLKTMSVEALYKLEDKRSIIRMGVQHHQFPFMDLNPATAVLTVRANSVTSLTLAFEHARYLSKKLRAEWLVRYQYPIMTGATNMNEFTISSPLLLDGSVGAVYLLNKETRLGMYWSGEYNQFNFSYGNQSSKFSGSQTLFYSHIDFRLGWEF